MRKLSSKVLALLWLVTATSLSALVVEACTCNLPPPVCSEYWEIDDIFVGSITKVYRPEDAVQERVDVKVEESFRGMDFSIAHTYNYGHSCAFTFSEGSTYLFYAAHDKDKPNEFGTSFCMRTLRDGDAEFTSDLEYLRSVKAGKSLFWIWGTISKIGYDMPFPGIRVTLLDQKGRIEGTSDARGDVKIEVPGPGKYRVRVHLPPSAKGFNYLIPNDIKRWEKHRKQIVGTKLKGRNRYVDYEVDVAANKCGWFDVSIPTPDQN